MFFLTTQIKFEQYFVIKNVIVVSLPPSLDILEQSTWVGVEYHTASRCDFVTPNPSPLFP